MNNEAYQSGQQSALEDLDRIRQQSDSDYQAIIEAIRQHQAIARGNIAAMEEEGEDTTWQQGRLSKLPSW